MSRHLLKNRRSQRQPKHRILEFQFPKVYTCLDYRMSDTSGQGVFVFSTAHSLFFNFWAISSKDSSKDSPKLISNRGLVVKTDLISKLQALGLIVR